MEKAFRGDRLRELRKAAGYIQEELGEKIKSGTRMINRYESGDVQPTGDVIRRMADVLDVSTDYLLGKSDLPNPDIREETLNSLERRLIDELRQGTILGALQTFTLLAAQQR